MGIDVPAAHDADAAVVPPQRGCEREGTSSFGDDVRPRGELAERSLDFVERNRDRLVDELLGTLPHPGEQ